jgi:hypothetical protein
LLRRALAPVVSPAICNAAWARPCAAVMAWTSVSRANAAPINASAAVAEYYLTSLVAPRNAKAPDPFHIGTSRPAALAVTFVAVLA